MVKKGLTRAFTELEEVVERLLSRGGGVVDDNSTGKPHEGSGRGTGKTGYTDQEATELIRKAIDRLKALY